MCWFYMMWMALESLVMWSSEAYNITYLSLIDTVNRLFILNINYQASLFQVLIKTSILSNS